MAQFTSDRIDGKMDEVRCIFTFIYTIKDINQRMIDMFMYYIL